jgi:hypothetical protein
MGKIYKKGGNITQKQVTKISTGQKGKPFS